MRNLIKILAILVLLPVVYVAGNLGYGTWKDFSPPETMPVQVFNVQDKTPDSVITLLTWNIGYAGLGKESDFFYDGGTTVRMSRDISMKNLEGIIRTLSSLDTVDIILLQEVDTLAKRSWWTNQFEAITVALGRYSAAFTLNYNVDFVPVPYLEPMGRVMGGLASFMRFTDSGAFRYQFPSSFGWPERIYFLDRCFLEQRIPLAEGRELVIINTHNSAFDDGSLKAAEMSYLRTHLIREFERGNSVIVGSDWNQGVPGSGFQEVQDPFIEGWKWAYDTTYPTNRELKAAFEKNTTATFNIDFFLISPDLIVEHIEVLNLDFEHSDHQPVFMRVALPGPSVLTNEMN
jgi:endonuclease/exonuclease/phosphatase family metal-dependent hydrolase